MSTIHLLIGSVHPAYGAARVCLDIANGLGQLGHEVTIVTHDSAAGMLPKEFQRVHIEKKRGALGWILFCARLRRYLRSDAVSAGTLAIGFLTMTNFALRIASIGLRGKVRVLLTEHNQQSLALSAMGRSGRASIRLMPLLYRNQRVLAVSEAVKEDLESECGVKGANIEVAYNPIDAERLRALAEEPLDPQLQDAVSQPFVACLAELKPAKQQRLLVEALARSQSDIRLALVGGGRDLDSLVALVHDLGLEERVIFTGRLENPWPLMKHARASILVPRFEGFGLSAAESAAVGVRPVGLAVGGLDEVLRAVDGVRISPGSTIASSLADALDESYSGWRAWDHEEATAWVARSLAPKVVAEKYFSFGSRF